MISPIEGIGNEVIQFFVVLAVVVLCVILWLSTRVRNTDDPFLRTVYVLERHMGNSIRRSTTMNRSITDSSNMEVSASSASTDDTTDDTTVDDTSATTVKDEQDDHCSTSSDVSNDNNKSTNDTKSSDETETNPIKIRIKYTNDDCREVEGVLNEKLVDFKRRIFPEEVSTNKLIRLIFNGRLLRDDNISLKSYGLFDDCVVHCLIVNERPAESVNSLENQGHSQSHSQNSSNNSNLGDGDNNASEWNFSKLLCFLVVGFLSLTWFCRYQFATLFTFTSTTFLVALTVIFFASIFGTYYSDTNNSAS